MLDTGIHSNKGAHSEYAQYTSASKIPIRYLEKSIVTVDGSVSRRIAAQASFVDMTIL